MGGHRSYVRWTYGAMIMKQQNETVKRRVKLEDRMVQRASSRAKEGVWLVG